MSFLSYIATPYTAGLVVGICSWIYGSSRRRGDNPKGLPLPPGPKRYPIIDNLLDFPTFKPWLVYNEWSKIYGDMIYLRVLGHSFLILESFERTYDLFERRSSNYSDRPRLPMLLEVMDWSWDLALFPYGTWWRRNRRAIHDHFHPNVVPKYRPVQVSTTRAFLRQLLESPDDFLEHVRTSFASTILKVIYGMNLDNDGEAKIYARTAESIMAVGGEVVIPGAFLVDLFPVMKYIPSWFPGAGWKKKGESWRTLGYRFAKGPWNAVRERLKNGAAEGCVAATFIEKLPDENSPNATEEEEIARNACATAFAAGSDTTASTVQSYFMAMALYPEIQKKAQEELDRVLCGRLPEFSDRENLPYINAMVKESMRWQLVTPIALPHMVSEADEYNGYYIPKDTFVIGNAWSILHDPETYSEPFTYNPERFLKDGKIDPKVRDPKVAFFGFGRRIYPGRFFSEDGMFILISHILSVFDIRPALDESGKEIQIVPEMTDGANSYPEPFKCRITPRSSKAEDLIRNSGLME